MKATQQAEQAGHIFPDMAACEAALESRYGTSQLAISANNLFGMKQHLTKRADNTYDFVTMPTKEYIDGEWKIVAANFCKYPDQAACFTDRMNTLKYLAPHYPHYAAALLAKDAIEYVNAVSLSWSTDPRRAAKVIAICESHRDL